MTTVTRRNVLKGGTALAGGMAGILAVGRAPAYAQAATVHWLRWTDFVPASDQLLRNEIAKECEKALGIKLNIETINANDIQARVTSAIQSGSGPDIVCVLNNWGQLYGESVVDVSDIAEALGKSQGGFYETSRAVANDGKKWIAVPWSIVGLQIAYRKSWFAEIGYTDGKFPQDVGGVSRGRQEAEGKGTANRPNAGSHLRRCARLRLPLPVVLGRQGGRGRRQDDCAE
ncbi:ABC-type glycerol-3-phosphate transport system substrate-binding protein [Bradyrhizobium japonicum]